MSIYGSYINENLIQIMNEAYIGKTPTLLEMEKEIGLIRSTMKKFTDINKSEHVQKLNRLFEKQFGMKVFALRVIQSSNVNAFTEVLNTRFDIAGIVNMSKSVIANQKDGYRFKQPNNFCVVCTIYWGLLGDPQYTDAEILAILLHELGHNFADGLVDAIDIANQELVQSYSSFLLLYALYIVTIPTVVMTYIKNTNWYKTRENSGKLKNPITGIVNGVSGKIADFNSWFNGLLLRLDIIDIWLWNSYKKGSAGKTAKKNAKKSASRQNEVVADKFAAVYGYGYEQSSALAKMDKWQSSAELTFEKMGSWGQKINDRFNDTYIDINDFDCHPRLVQRINEEIKTLEDELSRESMDPKFEKEIKAQIKQMQDLIKDVSKVVKDEGRRANARAVFNAATDSKCPDAISKELEDSILKAFNDKLDEGK